MIRLTRSLFSVAALAVLGSSLACAQQTPAQAPPPPDGSAQHGPRSGGPMGMQSRDGRGESMHGMGMRGEGRIAPMGMWWKNPELVTRIGLSADQTKKMDEIFQSSRIQLIDLKANVEKQEVVLEPMIDMNPIDAKRVLAQIGKVADARAELEKANAAMLLGIRGVLTAEQWTKLHTGDKDHHHAGPGGPGGGPGGHGRE